MRLFPASTLSSAAPASGYGSPAPEDLRREALPFLAHTSFDLGLGVSAVFCCLIRARAFLAHG